MKLMLFSAVVCVWFICPDDCGKQIKIGLLLVSLLSWVGIALSLRVVGWLHHTGPAVSACIHAETHRHTLYTPEESLHTLHSGVREWKERLIYAEESTVSAWTIECTKNRPIIMRSHHAVIVVSYLLSILISEAVRITHMKAKSKGYAFTPLELFCILASSDGNEVFAWHSVGVESNEIPEYCQ